MTRKKAKEIRREFWKIALIVLGRIVLYMVLAVSMALSILMNYLQSDNFEQLIADQIITGLRESIREPVSIKGVIFDLFGRRVNVIGLRILSANRDEFPDPLSVDTISIKVHPLDLLRGKLSISSLVAFRPDLVIEQRPDGTTNVPTFSQMEEADQSMKIAVEEVDVVGGMVTFNGQRIGWDLNSGSIGLSASNIGENNYRGTCNVSNLELNPPGVGPTEFSLNLEFLASPSQIIANVEMLGEGNSFLKLSRLSYLVDSQDIEADFDLSVDLSLLGNRWGRLSGVLSAYGDLSWRAGILQVNSTIEAPSLNYEDFKIDRLVDSIGFDGSTLVSNDFSAQLLGGEVHGKGAVENLFGSPHIVADFSLRDVPLAGLLSSTHLGFLQVDSRLSTQGSLEWNMATEDGPIVKASITGEMPEDQVSPWQTQVGLIRKNRDSEVLNTAVLPLSIDVRAEYSSGKLKILDGGNVSTPMTQLSVGGEVTADNFAVKLKSQKANSAEAALALTNLDRFFGNAFPDLEQVYGTASFVREFDAGGSFQLDLHGPADNMTFALDLQSKAASFLGQDIGSGSARLSFVNGEFLLDQINLQVGEGSAKISGKVILPPAGSDPEIPPVITATVVSEHLPLKKLEGFIPSDNEIDLGGDVTANLDLTIKGMEVTGNGKVELKAPRYGDFSAKQADFEVELGESLILENLDLRGNEGEIVKGSISLSPNTMDWHAKLLVRELRLSRYSKFLGEEADIDGLAELDLSLNGRKLETRGNASFKINNLYVQGVELGTVTGDFDSEGRTGEFKLIAEDQEYVFKAELEQENYDSVHFWLDEDIDLTGLVRKFVPDERLYLQVYDGISLRFVMGPDGFKGAELTLGRLVTGMEQFAIISRNVKVELTADNRLVFNNLAIAQAGLESNRAELNGWLELAENGKLNLNLKGGVNLLSFSDFFPEFSISGDGAVDLRLRGTIARPQLFGIVNVADGFIRQKETDITFSNIYGEVRLDEQRLELTNMSARFSEGSVLMDGIVQMNWATMTPVSYQFTVQGTDIHMTFEEGLDALFSSSLVFRGTGENLRISGDVNVERAKYTRRFDPEAEITRMFTQGKVAFADESLRNISLDIGLKGDEEIVVDNNFAQMQLTLDLRLLGTVAEPVITGRAEVLKGDVFYRDRRYRIDVGVIDFVNPNKIEPQFDFRAQTQVKDYRIFLELHGTLDRLYPELSSDPPESSIDILNLLATGKVRDNPFPSDIERSQEQLLGLGLSGFLTKQITGELERRAERLFGIDRFRIDPYIIPETTDTTARVTVGEQLTDDLSVIYSRNIATRNLEVLVFEYRLSPSLLIVGTREEDESFTISYGVDIHLQHRFK